MYPLLNFLLYNISCQQTAEKQGQTLIKLRYTTYDEVYRKERPQAKWIWKNVVEQHSFR